MCVLECFTKVISFNAAIAACDKGNEWQQLVPFVSATFFFGNEVVGFA